MGAALCVLLAGGLHAGVYKWVDEQGRVHFGDRPPAEQGEPVDLPASPPPSAPPSDSVPDRGRLLRMYEQERQDKQRKQAEQATADAERRRECDRTARTLRLYQRVGPLYDTLEDGSRRYLDGAEKDAEMAKLRGLLNKHCGGVPADLQPKQGR